MQDDSPVHASDTIATRFSNQWIVELVGIARRFSDWKRDLCSSLSTLCQALRCTTGL
jgi:hypothetical protein